MVSVIIINYNTYQLTSTCIESIVAHTKVDHEIILVDNCSTECDPDLFKEKFPFITLIKNPVNNGFASGNNLGIAAAKGDVILLLNSDTYLTEPAIDKSVRYLMNHPECGVLGCRMTYPDGSIQYTGRRFRTLQWELLDLFRIFLLLLPYKKRAQLMLGKYFNGDFNTSCDWINGAFFMFRKDILNQLPDGKLDNRFFMYGEDHLWCWQIQNLGYNNIFFFETTIVHINSASTSLDKRLALRKTMMKHELEIIRLRLGNGINYYATALTYAAKEYFRNAVKGIVYKISGRLIR